MLLGVLLAAAAAHGAHSLSQSSTPSFLILFGDDIGWADFRQPNNGTALTPNLSEWAATQGSLVLQDHHTGGTVCSPTRATVLTGRNHFRDCVDYVYDCSDPTECTPDMDFAPQKTFTIAHAARAAGRNISTYFAGKWHLGSFYNDSERYGGITSSPLTHGFENMYATIEVAPTATLNCQCNASWQPQCNYGHYGKMTHCTGGQGPDPLADPGCCFNYWKQSAASPHGVTNETQPTPDDDAAHLAAAFVAYLEGLRGAPFLAQVSFHNCHIPFVGTHARVQACNASDGAQCAPPLPGALPYNFQELDYYSCLNELDAAVGTVLQALKRLGYYDNTFTYFSVDNGAEVNCPPEGRCGSGSTGVIPPGTLHRPACGGAGSAGPLRGRKRDVWEGGHRVPAIVSWPAVITTPPAQVWDFVGTVDLLPTVMDVLGVARPAEQQAWALDGVSMLPVLRSGGGGAGVQDRGMGWMYYSPTLSAANGYAYRWGQWKYVVGGISCNPAKATFNCSAPQLYDMSTDIAEDHNLAASHPEVLAAAAANFSAWYASVHHSIAAESKCTVQPPPPPAPFPPSPQPSSACAFLPGKALNGTDMALGEVPDAATCCGACRATPGCAAGDFVAATAAHPTWRGSVTGGTCHLKRTFQPKPHVAGETQTACQVLG